MADLKRSAEKMSILAFTVSGSLALIAGLHLYWAFGGSWGARVALPKKEDGSLLFSPGPFACVLVAVGLLAIAWVCIARFALAPSMVGASVASKAFGIFGIIFALRVLGDFRYLGLFRKVRHTDFAILDARLYSPLCAAYSTAFITFAPRMKNRPNPSPEPTPGMRTDAAHL